MLPRMTNHHHHIPRHTQKMKNSNLLFTLAVAAIFFTNSNTQTKVTKRSLKNNKNIFFQITSCQYQHGTTHKNARTKAEKQHLLPQIFDAARWFGALQVLNKTVNKYETNTEIRSANGKLFENNIPSIPSKMHQRRNTKPNKNTYFRIFPRFTLIRRTERAKTKSRKHLKCENDKLAQTTTINTITTHTNAKTQNRKSIYPSRCVDLAQKSAKPKRKRVDNKNRKQNWKWHITSHHIQSPPPPQRKRPARITLTCTNISRGILVGAGIQQQPHAVRITIHSSPNQRRASVLQSAPNMPNCVPPPSPPHMPSAAIAHTLPPTPPTPPQCNDDKNASKHAKLRDWAERGK